MNGIKHVMTRAPENLLERYKDLMEPEASHSTMVNKRSGANDHLTLSAAHRLIAQLADDTLSRETQAECRDVMAKLEKMVGEG